MFISCNIAFIVIFDLSYKWLCTTSCYVHSLQYADHGMDSSATNQVRGLSALTQLLHKIALIGSATMLESNAASETSPNRIHSGNIQL